MAPEYPVVNQRFLRDDVLRPLKMQDEGTPPGKHPPGYRPPSVLRSLVRDFGPWIIAIVAAAWVVIKPAIDSQYAPTATVRALEARVDKHEVDQRQMLGQMRGDMRVMRVYLKNLLRKNGLNPDELRTDEP